MLYFFFKKTYKLFCNFILEVLKTFSNVHFISNFKLGFFFFSTSLWSDEIAYYIFSSFFDLFFFSNMFNINLFFFPHLLLFSFFSLVQFYFGNYVFYFQFFTFFFFGCFLLVFFLSVVFFFFFVSILLNLLDFLFKSNMAGLIIFSRDLLSIEDEDLWVSSNIFYFDDKLIEAKDFKIPLTAQEVEVFSTLIKLFFDVPSRNLEYYKFSDQLMSLKTDFRAHIENQKSYGSVAADAYFSTIYHKHEIPFNPIRFFISFFRINNFDDLIRKNPFFPQASNPFYINSRFYYPSFFRFLFRLMNFKLLGKNLKKKKLKVKQQERLRRSYLLFKTRVSFWKSKGTQVSDTDTFVLKSPLNNNFSKLNNNRPVNLFVNDQINQNQETSFAHFRSLKENFEFFSLDQKFSEEAFAHFRRPTTYNEFNNKIKLQRFRKFFWLSFPLYVIEVNDSFILFLGTNKFFVLISTLYKSFLSKFFYFVFSLFGNDTASETNLLFNYISTPYDPNIKIKRVHDNFLNFVDKKSVIFRFIETLIQSFFEFQTSEQRQNPEDLKKELNLAAESVEESKERRLQVNNQFVDNVDDVLEIIEEDEAEMEEDLIEEYLEEDKEEDEESSEELEEELEEDEEDKDQKKDKDKEAENKDEKENKETTDKAKDEKDIAEEQKVVETFDDMDLDLNLNFDLDLEKDINEEELLGLGDTEEEREEEEDEKDEFNGNLKGAEGQEAQEVLLDNTKEDEPDLFLLVEKRKKFVQKSHVLKQSLLSSKDYVFSNKYNSKSFLAYPRLELVDFYKLLEYFYFVLTKDVNFYEFAKFTRRVTNLQDKYGKAIVKDLLSSADHKQAKKVNMQMHIVDYDYQDGNQVSLPTSPENLSMESPFSADNNLDKELLRAKFLRKQRKSIRTKLTSDFVDDLILSYKHRFKK